jgi:radical SAM superfamily enzyme YgiQ (UPF0313 family)
MFLPFNYDQPLFRPPSEANSIILQVTLGCSWNICSFCEMYKTKQFHVKKEDDMLAEILSLKGLIHYPAKIFLADGDAMVLSTPKLLKIADALHDAIPRINRISVYALPSNILSKTDAELKQLYEAGYKLMYVGIESGHDELLQLVHKGETRKSTVDAILKARQAGIKSSVMILTGLGGKSYSEQHAIGSAEILNEIQPEYASTLVLSFPYGETHYQKQFPAYIPMTTHELLCELEIFLQHLDLKATIFRSDHASNYLVLKGVLNKDKEVMIQQLHQAIYQPLDVRLRKEWERGF